MGKGTIAMPVTYEYDGVYSPISKFILPSSGDRPQANLAALIYHAMKDADVGEGMYIWLIKERSIL